MPRAIGYIDGFNLFHGLEESGLKQHYWLDLHRLCQELMSKTGFEVVRTRYFTSRVPHWHPHKNEQDVWLEAVRYMEPEVVRHWGSFRNANCKLCPAKKRFAHEKGSDVNLGLWALTDYID